MAQASLAMLFNLKCKEKLYGGQRKQFPYRLKSVESFLASRMNFLKYIAWFRKTKKAAAESKLVLICDSPLCRKEIKGDLFVYSIKYKELYHSQECLVTADSIRAQQTGEPPFSNPMAINRYFAVNLYTTGRLAKSRGIEKKLE